jgi:hypothetical protein
MSVSYAAGDLWVGAPLEGGAYVFRRSEEGDWREVEILSIASSNSFMGWSVATDDNTAVVGSPGADFFEGVGSVYYVGCGTSARSCVFLVARVLARCCNPL